MNISKCVWFINNVIILILLLLYDFEFENVEIKQTWNLKLENMTDLSDKQAEKQTNKPVAKRGYLNPPNS